MSCGKCVDVCPTGTLSGERCGYRVLLGGKLGRHPRLAEALPDIYSEEEVVQIVQRCLTFYKGHRFADLLSETDINRLVAKDNPS